LTAVGRGESILASAPIGRFVPGEPNMWPIAQRHHSPDESSGPQPRPDLPLAPFFDATADAMLVYGPDFIVLAANEAAGRLLHEPGRLLGRSVLESSLLARLLAASSVPQRLQGDTRHVRDEVTIADIEGQPLQCRLEALRLDDGRILLHLQDTTPVQRAIAALRSLEELHRASAAVLPGVTWTMALPEERLVDVSPAVERLFGYEPAALLGRPELWAELAHPGDRERVLAEFRTGVDGGRPFDIHFTGVHRDRRDLPHLVHHVTPVRGGGTWAERAYGFIEDLSGHEALRRELAETRARLRVVLDTIPAGVAIVRLRRGRAVVALCNRRLAEMLRLDQPIRPDTPLTRAPADLLLLLRGGEPDGESAPRLTRERTEEYVVELRDPLRVLRTHAGPLRDERGAVDGRILTAEDITTSWRMQRRLTQAQQHESLARLAGGMAHDFNNLLGTIQGFAALLRDRTSEDDPRHEAVAQILDAVARAERLTAALLESSRTARFERVPLNLNRVIQESYGSLRSALDPSASLVSRLAPELPLLLGDARLLRQLLVVLVQELRPRLGIGGSLAVATRLVEQERPPEEARGERETVHGIALELLLESGAATPRAVEPLADRTGLGLSVAEDIARAHGGWLVAGADPGAPAFRVIFPVDTPDEAPLLVPAAATGHGHETVLVVDDEPGLRALARTGLHQHGFDVITVETGEQALEILGRGEPAVDAMLLDLTLPGISGEAVLREVRRLSPQLPVIIASGYATVESQASWMEAGAVGFVAKPFHVQQVAQRLREALDRVHPER
jgi:two-component system, cell cycle sensor histidine kinase and response regulator CckA